MLHECPIDITMCVFGHALGMRLPTIPTLDNAQQPDSPCCLQGPIDRAPYGVAVVDLDHLAQRADAREGELGVAIERRGGQFEGLGATHGTGCAVPHCCS